MSVVSAESELEGLFSFSNLYQAYLACRKRKRNTLNALEFESCLLDNLDYLSESLRGGGYRPSRSLCFVVTRPKLREVFSADFKDRVVRHLWVPRLEKIYEPKFIHDSYCCRKNKGTHKAVKRLQSFMQKTSKNGKQKAWFLQMDIKSFFMSIDKEILLGLLNKQVEDPVLLGLCRQNISHDPTVDHLFKGQKSLLAKVPAHKSLLKVSKGKGLPIGNLSSQFFANLYLNELDQWVKHSLKAKFYLRYMDDFILLSPSQEQLLLYKTKIIEFVQNRLALECKSDWTLSPVSQGADFLGYIIRPNYLLIRKRVIGNLKEKLHQYALLIQPQRLSGPQNPIILSMPLGVVVQVRQTLASYLGHFKLAKFHHLLCSLREQFPWLDSLFLFGGNGRLTLRVEPDFRPGNLQAQVSWFFRKYKNLLLVFQIGQQFEVFGGQTQQLIPFLQNQPHRKHPRFTATLGFHRNLWPDIQAKLKQNHISYGVITEAGFCRSGLKRRVMSQSVIFNQEIS